MVKTTKKLLLYLLLKEIEKNVKEDAFVSILSKRITDEKERIFKVTISTILSARTRDEITEKICKKLFEKIKSWEDLEKIEQGELEKLIYGVGFYKNKAKLLKKLVEKIKENNYMLPDKIEKLVKLPGIGPKTANIIITEGFKKEGLAVDTHVHRIVNRLGIIDTLTPLETEKKLKTIINKKDWKKVNSLLVSFGRQICNVKPKCEKCFFNEKCPYYFSLLTLNKILKENHFQKIELKKIDKLEGKGTYIIKIYLKNNRKIKKWVLKKGYYFYVGSANMKNGLKARIKRHLQKNKKLFWHIDYLTSHKDSTITAAFFTYQTIEKEISKKLSSFLTLIPSFGNSDDKENKSHLFYIPP